MPFFDALFASPLLRLFLVMGVGLLLGAIPFPGRFRLGIAAVLFTGLAAGALRPGFTVPPVLQDLGLVIFVYGIGLQAGPGFFASLRRDGLRLNLAVAAGLLAAFVLGALVIHFAALPPRAIAGVYCGGLTSTPALGAATEAVLHHPNGRAEADEIVVGYGLAYPFAIAIVLSFLQILIYRDHGRSAEKPVDPGLEVRTVLVTHAPPEGFWPVGEVERRFQVRLTRVSHPGGRQSLPAPDTSLLPGMLAVAVGSPLAIRHLTEALGELPETPPAASSDFEVLDLHVSNPAVCGRPLEELELADRGATISRVRRGDAELVARPGLLLQPGDEVRLVVHRSHFQAVARFFGNSLATLAESGYPTFAIGILLGLSLGQIPIPVPGLPAPLHLGVAGGPLLAGLFLGWLGRTGRVVWSLPYGLNLGLRNLGILVFLAAVGMNAGSSVLPALRQEGPVLIVVAIGVTLAAHLLIWAALLRLGERNLPTILGVLSGAQTQPAALTFAADRVAPDKVNLGYASVYPLATLLKIVLAQVLLNLR